MLHNYVITSLRNLNRHRFYSFLNILSLSIGLTVSALILIWISDELSVNDTITDQSSTYQVYERQTYTDGQSTPQYATPGPLANELADGFPEVSSAGRYSGIYNEIIIKSDEKLLTSENGYLSDPSIFEILNFEFLDGNKKNALANSKSIVLGESMAVKLFGDDWKSKNIIGKMIQLNSQFDFQISSVVKDFPENSTLNCNFIIELENGIETLWNWDGYNDWGNNFTNTYIKLVQNADPVALDYKIRGIAKSKNELSVIDFYLIKFSDIYLYNLDGEGGRIEYVKIFGIISAFILLLACVNFMNLSTARSSLRAKEIGVRKTLGAYKSQLIFQFLTESILVAFISLFISAILLVMLATPYTILTGKALNFLHAEGWIGLVFILIAVFTGLLSGSYPAFYMSGFRPVDVLRGKLALGSGNLRKILVVFQFGVSITLIICSLIIYRQLDYMKNKNLGFEKDKLIYFNLPEGFDDRIDFFKNELVGQPSINGITAANDLPLNTGFSTSNIQWGRKEEEDIINIHCFLVDFDYISTLEMQILEGRSFSKNHKADLKNYIVNEDLANLINPISALGETLKMWGQEGKVVGVVKNFNFKKLNKQSGPAIIKIMPELASKIIVNIDIEKFSELNKALELAWVEVFPEIPYNLRFVDNAYENLYQSEKRLGNLTIVFAAVAILISCMGLLGLASFVSLFMQKQLVIRKILGANIRQLILTFSKRFIGWVVISNILAVPLAFYIMQLWLADFKYRIEFDWWIVIVMIVFSVTIALLTTGFHAVQSALVNPVTKLRNE